MRKKENLFIIIFILVIGVIGSTFAYYKINHAPLDNVFVASRFDTSYETEIISNLCMDNEKNKMEEYNFSIKNTSDKEFMVRLTLEEEWTDNSGNVVSSNMVNNEKMAIIKFVNSEDWKKLGNYYYYKYSVKPNEETSNLIEGIEITKNYDGTNMCHYDTNTNVGECTESSFTCETSLFRGKIKLDVIQTEDYEEVWNVDDQTVKEESVYTVNFLPNGTDVTGSMQSEDFVYGERKALLENTYVKEGYDFIEWNTNYLGRGKSFKDKEEVLDIGNGDKDIVNLYAIWEPKGYTVSFVSNVEDCPLDDNVYGTFKAPETGLIKESAIPNPTCLGYDFEGWMMEGDINYETAMYGTVNIPTSLWVDGNKGTYFKDLSYVDGSVVISPIWNRDNTICINTSLVEFDDIVCKRADTLNTTSCDWNDNNSYCSGSGYTESGKMATKTITYGNCGTSGELNSGDAFDCDVNGDGNFNERFYYVSDYYNTKTREFESDTAVLIYSNNVSSGVANNNSEFAYESSNKNYVGPKTAYLQLPTTDSWSNVSLKNSERQIITYNGKSSTTGGALPSAFDYSSYAARLLATEELEAACGITVGNKTRGELDNCIYLMENTKYSASSFTTYGYWLENPKDTSANETWHVGATGRIINTNTANKATTIGVRPVIEVKKEKLGYYRVRKNEYIIKFDGNGEDYGYTNVNVCKYDSDCTLNSNGFVKEHYTFLGWSLTPNGEKVYRDGETVRNVTEDKEITLYAIWVDGATMCSNNKDVIISNEMVCKRAEKLHTEKCFYDNPTSYCSGSGYTLQGSKKTNTIMYGNCGVSGTLTEGDAFDCDVNGDGIFDSTNERFYYVSDYYNTSTKEFNNNIAVLIYSNNVSSGIANNKSEYAYSLNNSNYGGPVTSILQLPTNAQWSNIDLINSHRQILAQNLNPSTNGGTLPSSFDYSNYSARLITSKEIENACGITIGSRTSGELDNCNYLMENTKYSNSDLTTYGYWLETPLSDSSSNIWHVGATARIINDNTANRNVTIGVRPVIEIEKYKMSYYNINDSEYLITYNGNGAKIGYVSPTVCAFNEDCEISENSYVRPGYLFTGWSTTLNGDVIYQSGNIINKNSKDNINLYAKWTPYTYSVNFTSSDNIKCPLNNSIYANITNINYDQLISDSALPNPECTGYLFTGWTASGDIDTTTAKYGTINTPNMIWTDKNKGTYFKNLSTTNNGTVTLTAIFAKAIYFEDSDKIIYAQGNNLYDDEKITIPFTGITPPMKNGYTFDGYYTKGNGGGVQVIASSGTLNSNIDVGLISDKLYIKWIANTYTIAFNGNGNTGGSTSNKTCIYDQDCILTSNGFTKTDYKFDGWATSSRGNVVYENSATVKNLATSGTYTLYAKWKVNFAVFGDGQSFNRKIKSLVSGTSKGYYDSDNLVEKMKWTSSLPNGFVADYENTVSTSSGKPIYTWYDSSIKTIYFYTEASEVRLNSDSSGMFKYFSTLNDISFLSIVDTSSVTDMSSMFYECISLTNLNALQNWDTSSVTDMSSMFYSCDSLTNISALSRWYTSGVTDMGWMFKGCSSLVDISALSNWNTSRVTDMNSMFDLHMQLTDISALSKWNTSSVTNMFDMFFDCQSLTSLNGLQNWDTSSVTNMNGMFSQCTSLIDISALSSWNTSSVTDMTHMFSSVKNLTNISALSRWDTSSVTNMTWMFRYCSKIQGTFTIKGNPTSYGDMFEDAAIFGSGVVVNYSRNTTNIDAIIGTKGYYSNVTKGSQID